jgi:hypothetical protein
MKTLKQVLLDNSEYKTLINAIIKRIGVRNVSDVINHGIDGGFNGFIHTADTTHFFRRHKSQIMQLARNLSDDMGEDLLSMIQNFNCLGKDFSMAEIAETIFANSGTDAQQIQNAMAWFAAEEVCRMFED